MPYIIRSPGADACFNRHSQGKGIHRLREAKVLLAATEPAVVLQVASWRKQFHYLHSNTFPQSFILSVAEWSALRGVEVKFEGALVSLQKVAVQFAFRRSERITRPIIIPLLCDIMPCSIPRY